MKTPSICIVSHNAYGAMVGGSGGHIGGVERQTSMTAKWLAARGYAISIITWDENQEDERLVDAVRCIKVCNAREGLLGLRFLHPRITSLIGALKKANADLYYYNCAEYYAGVIAWWCKRNGRGFIYSTAHDYDCKYDVPLPSLHTRPHKAMYRYGIRNANRRIVQTEYQRRLLEAEFGLSSIALPMPCIGPSDEEVGTPKFPSHPRVVWVGRLDPQKRLEWLLDLAETLPRVLFEIAAAGQVEDRYGTALFERAKRISNIKWLGPIRRDLMPRVYRGSLCLCCTSIHEGFPNTFLEAWSHAVPLVTSFDPDNIVERHNLGRTGKSVHALAAGIKDLLSAPDTWQTAARNGRRYFVEYHSVDAAMARFERVFGDAINATNGFSPAPGTHPVQINAVNLTTRNRR